MFVTIGLPVRNAGDQLADTVRSVLLQDFEDFELLISDNASTDNTEDVCRELAKSDERIRYVRHPANIGMLPNFISIQHVARGDYLRWIGDDDRLETDYLSRVAAVFAADPDLLLVTTGISYTGEDGDHQSTSYEGTALGSADPVDRFEEFLRLLNSSYMTLDPLYGVMRLDRIKRVNRPLMLREDEIFATRLALAGRWGHVDRVLAHRLWKHQTLAAMPARLNIPSWQRHFANSLQAREMVRALSEVELTTAQRSRAMAAIRRWMLLRQRALFVRRGRRLLALTTGR